MKTILHNSISLFLCLSLFACGERTKSKAPLPKTIPTTAPIGPTVIGPTVQPTPAQPTTTVPPTLTTGGTGATCSQSTAAAVTVEPLVDIPRTEVPVLGTAETFEIGTWNIENYPKASGSLALVSNILNTLDVDVMAVEEISTPAAFNALIAEMPKFTGLLAPDAGTQFDARSAGFIYRTADFKLVTSEALFPKDNFAFPRPPLLIRLHPLAAGRPDVVAIAVHLKAFGDDKSQQRREAANIQLESYVAELKAKEPRLHIIVLGDFNQPLVGATERAVFNPWFEKGCNYTVRTDSLVKKGDYSYFSNRLSLIDHMVTTSDFLLEEPVIVKLQKIVPNYESQASDHLPVVARLAP